MRAVGRGGRARAPGRAVGPCRAAEPGVEAVPSAGPTPTPRTLGGSGLEVSEVGIGCWSWGDRQFWNDGSWDAGNADRAQQAFEGAMASGMTWFDTAEVYGTKQFGAEDSEALLGRFIREHGGAERAVVATKFAALPWRFGPASVVAACKGSLERLGVDQLDLYQLHWPGLWGNVGYIDGLAACVNEGLTKSVGCSNYSAKRVREAHAQLAKQGVPLASNQVQYNILYRAPEANGVLDACRDLGVAVVAYCPLSQGVLTGKYDKANRPSGPRAVSYTETFFEEAEPLFQVMGELAEKYGKTRAQIAIRWLLDIDPLVIPIPGAKTAEQVEEFRGAFGWELDEGEVLELRRLGERVTPIQGFPVETW